MNRRTLLTAGGTLVASALAGEAHARARRSAATPQDQRFMQLAIEQAKGGDFPFGAVIVREDRVLALGRNSTKRTSDPTAHAEMVAIRAFLTGHEPEDFQAATMYASGEPCPMCMGAIVWCGFRRLVYGASIAQIAGKIEQIDVTAREIANAAPFIDMEFAGGVMSANALELFDKKEN